MSRIEPNVWELIISVALTLFIIAYVIYWYFFEERPDVIRI